MEYSFLPGVTGDAVIVAHAYELCDRGFLLRHVTDTTLRRADIVIVPEINRLWMLKVRSRSQARFFEIPNRHLEEGNSGAEDGRRTRQIFLENGGSDACSRFLIYQGAFMEGRALREVLQAFRGVKDNSVGLILLGGGLAGDLTSDLKELAQGDSRVVVLRRMPPPTHLAVTGGCLAGILLYTPLDLNNVYCAPNKIYEYAAAGLGMILPDYPGVGLLGRTYGLGEVCDPEDVQSIRKAMERVLTRDQSDFRSAAARFLQSTSRPEEMYRGVHEEIVARIQQRRSDGAGMKGRKD
jgi:glycosyltransferase involved in cell wall biosynthesis